MPTNEVLFVSATVNSIVIRVNNITLLCADGVSRGFTKEEFQKISRDVRDNGPDTYYKKHGVESLLLRRPSLELIDEWLKQK